MKRRSDYRPVQLTCPACGKVFETTEYRLRYGVRYCSRRCAATRNHRVPHRPLAERFWEKVDQAGDCWPWTGSLNNKGYGQITVEGRRMLAHRLSWELAHGSLHPDAIVCHRCDNPRCVRPDHLFIGTMGDNQRDMAHKGRSRRGETHPMARLTKNEVLDILVAHAGGARNCDLAREYGVSPQTISSIVTRRSWKHIDVS